MSPGLFEKRGGTNLVEMDPAQLEAQRKRVQEIRENLPAFEYGLEGDVDDKSVQKETRPQQTLPDNAKYTGQWAVASNERHGTGN